MIETKYSSNSGVEEIKEIDRTSFKAKWLNMVLDKNVTDEEIIKIVKILDKTLPDEKIIKIVKSKRERVHYDRN